jgi:hypothetical protein
MRVRDLAGFVGIFGIGQAPASDDGKGLLPAFGNRRPVVSVDASISSQPFRLPESVGHLVAERWRFDRFDRAFLLRLDFLFLAFLAFDFRDAARQGLWLQCLASCCPSLRHFADCTGSPEPCPTGQAICIFSAIAWHSASRFLSSARQAAVCAAASPAPNRIAAASENNATRAGIIEHPPLVSDSDSRFGPMREALLFLSSVSPVPEASRGMTLCPFAPYCAEVRDNGSPPSD